MRRARAVWLVLALGSAVVVPAMAEECTSAVLSPAVTAPGRPVLWKNRDTGTLSNKVVFVREQPYSFLALANFDSPSGRMVYAGLNETGFAIMNTVAYNLPQRSSEMHDLEGVVMADALRTCRTAADFERYLAANQGPDLGSQANFGVLDGDGTAVLYEVHNHGFVKHDAAAAPERYLVNTNFARSGANGEGAGYLRFERATALFRSLPTGPVETRTILTTFTRDIGHVLLRNPALDELHAIPAGRDEWISSRDTIDRSDTSAAVVIVGKKPGDPSSVATMWVIPGEPLTAIAVPLWVEADESPAPLWQGDEAPMWRESMRIKRILRPYGEGHKSDYANLARLDNAAGTGYLPGLLRVEREILDATEQLLGTPHAGPELTAFQREMAEKALAALSAVR